jgi:ATP-dependent RNA helicase SUPV3L1/SUV3
MVAAASDRARVVAVLGPTNTGKTHFAVERMLAHRSGLIGFPLRLLAREIYDRIVAIRGPRSVALVTGEEKIAPPGAPYVVATVEAMPEHLEPSFLAVDEIQLCADPERGHVFTDRLLNARGRDETMFLGAETIRPLLKRLVPEAEVITRPRFSTLSYVAPSKVTRLPRRSAVVAFTAQDVYALAELVRRRRGGAAVVLGALSPRTRNAQVALYQAGEVDYLIATDAIGMGLNMDLGHVALASLHKFDGAEHRRLHAHEMAQIAGRAGRHMQDGTFSTTHEADTLEPKTIEAIETHDFPTLKRLFWRSSSLDFSSLEALMASLEAAPPAACLVKTRGALDDVSLKLLGRREPIAARARTPDRVRLLWSVCQVPDFRKTLTDAHLHILGTLFCHLADRGRLSTDWVADQVVRLERTDGDIDQLIARLAHIRTWTYISHRDDWLNDALHWQERTRAVEDRLSDALHDRLTQRFIDRRTQALFKSLHSGKPFASVAEDGAILVEGQEVGELRGLQVILKPGAPDLEQRTLMSATRRAVRPEVQKRVRALAEAPDKALCLDDLGQILWRNGSEGAAAIARLRPGAEILGPRLELLIPDYLSGQAREALSRRLSPWLEQEIATLARPLQKLRQADLEGPGRGLAFMLVEGLGNVGMADAGALARVLGAADRARLTRLGVRFGVRHLYLPALLKGRAVALRARLWSIHSRVLDRAPPAPGRVAFPTDAGQRASFAPAIGFEALGGWNLRIDIVERLAARLRALSRNGAFALEPELMALTGLRTDDLSEVLAALGYAAEGEGRFVRRRARIGRQRPRPGRARAASASPFAELERLRRSG